MRYRANDVRRRNRRVVAEDEIEVEDDMEMREDASGVNIDPEAYDLMFEASDVAELVSEITGEEVSVEADGNQVVFNVGEDTYTVEADEDDEILECTRVSSKRAIKANTSRAIGKRRPVKASSRMDSRRRRELDTFRRTRRSK